MSRQHRHGAGRSSRRGDKRRNTSGGGEQPIRTIRLGDLSGRPVIRPEHRGHLIGYGEGTRIHWSDPSAKRNAHTTEETR